ALKMDLIGARADSSPVGVGTLETRVHYLLGNNPDGWHTNVPVYSRVEYRNVYPGITAAYYANQGQFEYDFEVAPGADPARIRIRFEGMEQMQIDAEGNLVQRAAGGEFH